MLIVGYLRFGVMFSCVYNLASLDHPRPFDGTYFSFSKVLKANPQKVRVGKQYTCLGWLWG